MASRGSPPGRSSVGSPTQETIVNSTPTLHGPASTMRSIRPRRSVSTCAALVGETWPERFAEGATIGPPKAASKCVRDRMRGHAHRDGVEPGQCKIGDMAIRLLGQHERQRSGPECGGQPFGGFGEDAGDPGRIDIATCAISGLKAGRPLAA